MRKNSIRERAKKNSPEVKEQVRLMRMHLDALWLLSDITSEKEYYNIRKKIIKKYSARQDNKKVKPDILNCKPIAGEELIALNKTLRKTISNKPTKL